MKLVELNKCVFLNESKDISMSELNLLIKKNLKPLYILVAGGVGSGKSFIVDKNLDVDVVDPDKFTVELGDGFYDEKNVAKSMALVKKAVKDKLNGKQTFLQQGTSANLQSTMNKLKVAKENGFTTVLLYVDTPVEQAFAQIEKRVSTGGHGKTIDIKKVEKTSAGAKLTFATLTGVDFDTISNDDEIRVKQAFEKTQQSLKKARENLDYFVKIKNNFYGDVT